MDALAARDSFLAALPRPISWNEWQHQLRLRGLPQLPSGEYRAAMTARFGPDCMVTLKQSKTPGPAPDRRCASCPCPTELPAPHAVTESPEPLPDCTSAPHLLEHVATEPPLLATPSSPIFRLPRGNGPKVRLRLHGADHAACPLDESAPSVPSIASLVE